MAREKQICFARFAARVERYDDMASHMEAVCNFPDGLSVEERNLLSVAYEKAVGTRRDAWRIIMNMEKREEKRGDDVHAQYARDFRSKIELEVQMLCNNILKFLSEKLVDEATIGESKAFYQKMKADYYRYVAEFSDGNAKEIAAENARLAYEEACEVVGKELVVTSPIRLGVALNYSVFLYEVLQNPDEACLLASAAFDEAFNELDRIPEESYNIMQLLHDNFTVWTDESDPGEGEQ